MCTINGMTFRASPCMYMSFLVLRANSNYFPCATLTEQFLKCKRNVFTARQEMSLVFVRKISILNVISSHRTGLYSQPVDVRYVFERVTQGQIISSRYINIPPLNMFPAVFHNNLSLNITRYKDKRKKPDLGNVNKNPSIWISFCL